MRKITIGATLLGVAIVSASAAVAFPKLTRHDAPGISSANKECAKQTAWMFLDDPIERILLILGTVVVADQRQEVRYDKQYNASYLTGYTAFGIPLVKVRVTCDPDGGAQRLWDIFGFRSTEL